MDNQHKHIVGYRDLTADEINLMNEGKDLAERVGEYIKKLEAHNRTISQLDGRFLQEGKMDIQKGFMCVIRSIAKPSTF